MTPYDYWAILRKAWILIAITTVAGALVGLGLSLLTTPQYQATAQLFVSVKSVGQVSDAYNGGLFVQQRVKSYVDVVDSPAVLEPVIQALNLGVPYTSLAKQVAATTPPNTVLLNVTATNTNPDQAAKIVNAVADSYADEIARLEGASRSGDPSPASGSLPSPSPSASADTVTLPVQATVIKPATAGLRVVPQTRNNVLMGGLLGLLVGFALAILRNTLDTSVRSPEQLDEATGASGLGIITFDPDAGSTPLVTLRGSSRAEAFRTIRTNLQYVDVDRPPQVVVVTSSVPNEGKSSTAANLAIAVAQAGSRVLLLEADLRRPKLPEYLAVDGSRGLTDVLVGRIPLQQAIIRWQRGLLDFLPAGTIPPNPSELLGSRHMAKLLEELRQRYEMIIVDAPPLLPITDAAVLAAVTDGALLVVRCGSTGQEQVVEAADALRQVSARLLGTVLNFVPMRGRSKYGYGYGYGSRPQSLESRRPPPRVTPQSSVRQDAVWPPS